MARPELTYFRAQPTDPGAFQGPPRSCPMCLVGACHGCNGHLLVHDAAGHGRTEACEHPHRPRRVGGVVPAAEILRRAEA